VGLVGCGVSVVARGYPPEENPLLSAWLVRRLLPENSEPSGSYGKGRCGFVHLVLLLSVQSSRLMGRGASHECGDVRSEPAPASYGRLVDPGLCLGLTDEREHLRVGVELVDLVGSKWRDYQVFVGHLRSLRLVM